MPQYINKSALVVEIERLQATTMDEDGNFYTAKAQAEYYVLCMLESLIDTLEVKEIEDLQGLEKEVAKDKNILILKKILSRFFESANANNEEFSKAIEDIENGLI